MTFTAIYLAEVIEADPASRGHHIAAAVELRRLQGLIDACNIYLKAGETPAERIAREHSDRLTLMELLAKEKQKTEALLEALKLARSIIGHPDDAHTQFINAAIKATEGEKA